MHTSISCNSIHKSVTRMNNVFQLIADVGAPIAGALIMGAFIFIIMKQIMGGVVVR